MRDGDSPTSMEPQIPPLLVYLKLPPLSMIKTAQPVALDEGEAHTPAQEYRLGDDLITWHDAGASSLQSTATAMSHVLDDVAAMSQANSVLGLW